MVALMLLAVATTVAVSATAQFANTAHSAQSAAMGGCYVRDTARHLALAYRHTYGLAALAQKRVSAQVPLGMWGLGMSYMHCGNADYHEQRTRMEGTIRVARWVEVGVEAEYLHLGTDDPHYAPQQWMAAAAAVHLTLSRRVVLSLVGGSRPWDASHPWRARGTLTYRPANDWTTVVEAEHEERLRLRAGAEYLHDGVVALRAGVASAPLTATFGAGVRTGALRVDLAAETHSHLGITPHISMTLWF